MQCCPIEEHSSADKADDSKTTSFDFHRTNQLISDNVCWHRQTDCLFVLKITTQTVSISNFWWCYPIKETCYNQHNLSVLHQCYGLEYRSLKQHSVIKKNKNEAIIVLAGKSIKIFRLPHKLCSVFKNSACSSVSIWFFFFNLK